MKNPLTGANYSAASAPYPSSCNVAVSGSGTRIGFPIAFMPHLRAANKTANLIANTGDRKPTALMQEEDA